MCNLHILEDCHDPYSSAVDRPGRLRAPNAIFIRRRFCGRAGQHGSAVHRRRHRTYRGRRTASALPCPDRGVAQVSGGRLLLADQTTEDQFSALFLRHAAMGTFVPISPMIASMVNDTDASHDVVQDIRRAAARQHLDYVLIVEVAADSTEADTALAVADVTLVLGAVLPTRVIKVQGVGQALFVDVRNGYPYATAQISQDLQGLARSFGTYRRQQALEAKALTKTRAALVPEIDAMLTALAAESTR